MKALITGASSGIGRDIARRLGALGWELILVARRRDRLEELKRQLPVKAEVIPCDLSDPDACVALYKQVRGKGVHVLINNAGFGAFGAFDTISLRRELDMLSVNVTAVHILTKLFLRDFVRRDYGAILNVASSAAFLPGPLMATYYASKAYVLRLTQGIREELRQRKSRVIVSALCPGPVRTAFDQRAGVTFHLKSLSSEEVARVAVDGLLAGKPLIIPGLSMKLAYVGERLLPEALAARIVFHIQHRKETGYGADRASRLSAGRLR